jgi:hypothetical protein
MHRPSFDHRPVTSFRTWFRRRPIARSHSIIDTQLAESEANGGVAGWWELEVIGVTSPAVWDQIVAGKSLATVRALQTAGTGITDDILTNSYLFFSVRPKN